MSKSSDKNKEPSAIRANREPPEVQLLRILDYGAKIDALVDEMRASIPQDKKERMAAVFKAELYRELEEDGLLEDWLSMKAESRKGQASPADRLAGAVIRFADFADDALRKVLASVDRRFATAFQPRLANARFLNSRGGHGAAPVPETSPDPNMIAAAEEVLARLPDWSVVPVAARKGVEPGSTFAIVWKGEGTAPDLSAEKVMVSVDGAPLDPDEDYVADHSHISTLPPGHVCVVFGTVRPAGVTVKPNADGTLLLDFQSS